MMPLTEPIEACSRSPLERQFLVAFVQSLLQCSADDGSWRRATVNVPAEILHAWHLCLRLSHARGRTA
jgi:hypothetical protein